MYDMNSAPVFPVEISGLFERGVCTSKSSMRLPPGEIVRTDEGDGRPGLWVASGPGTSGLWSAVFAEYGQSGLWPLLLGSLRGGDEFRPWETGELYTEKITSPVRHDPAQLLSEWWKVYVHPTVDSLSKDERISVTDPYGQEWPGMALAHSFSEEQASSKAFELAERLLSHDPSMRLGIVAADRGADSLAVAGWTGPENYTNDTGEVAAVVRSWEERYGARVVGVGFSDLHLSVAAPPLDLAQALPIAAEHFAFCPDNVWQNSTPPTLMSYAQGLIGAVSWKFWWD